jgi:hypothetical protein
MIRFLCLSILYFSSGLSFAENISSWRDAAKKGLDSVKQASGTDKRYLLASYRFTANSHYAGEFYCDTSMHFTGHKFIDGTACQITYNFVARDEYSGLQLAGSFMESQQAETCEEAEKICKQTKISFREKEKQLEILNQEKLIARIIYNNGLPGFLSE